MNDLKLEFDKIFSHIQSELSYKDLLQNNLEESKKEEIIKSIIQKKSSKENQNRIISELCGYGPLEELLPQEEITEIIAIDKNKISYEKNGKLYILEESFLSDISFKNTIEKICIEAHITTHFKKPFAEGKWKNFRAHIICHPIIKNSFHLTLRRQKTNVWTLKDLKDNHWASSEAIDIIKSLIKEKINLLITGPTGSGKTSLLNACLQNLEKNERIVSIEDTDEIIMPNSLSTKLLTQSFVDDTYPSIDQEMLLKQSLRLRPDRIIMGEVRGKEAKDLILALSSGHQGSIGTIHANQHQQALYKLETLAQLGAPQWKTKTIQKLIHFGIQGIIVLEKRRTLRLLKGIYKITGYERSGFLFQTLFQRSDVPPIYIA